MESRLAILHEGTCGTSWYLIYDAWDICPNTVAINLKLCWWFFKQKGCIRSFQLYFSFIQSNDDRLLYKTDIDILLNDKNNKVKSWVKQIQAILRKKKLTEDGEKRKDRIICRLFIQSKQMLLYVNFYCAVLPLLKRFVLLFQTQKPMIHVLHDEQFSLVKKFLGCFIKPECIKDLRPKKLAQEMLQKEVFLGQSTDKLLKKRQEPEFV